MAEALKAVACKSCLLGPNSKADDAAECDRPEQYFGARLAPIFLQAWMDETFLTKVQMANLTVCRRLLLHFSGYLYTIVAVLEAFHWSVPCFL